MSIKTARWRTACAALLAAVIANGAGDEQARAQEGAPAAEEELIGAEAKREAAGASAEPIDVYGYGVEAEEEVVASIPGVRVELRGIDKLTGEVATIDADVNGAVKLWRLEIEVSACYRRPAQRAPESSVFLKIFDSKYDPSDLVFAGWMFASSPALSSMDHPRYDVWVLNCSTS